MQIGKDWYNVNGIVISLTCVTVLQMQKPGTSPGNWKIQNRYMRDPKKKTNKVQIISPITS